MILHYNKKLMKQTITQSDDTIPMTDALMADYRHYAGNLNDKSLELIQEVGQVPYLEYYELKEDGNRYSHYKDEKVDGVYVPDLDKIAELEAEKALIELKQEKELRIASLVITTSSGNTFQVDDISRATMNEAIQASALLGITTHDWKMADNTIVSITIDELKEALALGIQAKGAVILGV